MGKKDDKNMRNNMNYVEKPKTLEALRERERERAIL